MTVAQRLKDFLAHALPRPGRRSRAAPPPPLGRGYIENVVHSGRELEVEGWLFAAGHDIDEYRLDLDGHPAAQSPPTVRADVQQAFAYRPEAERSGFVLRAESPRGGLRDWTTVEILGLSEGRTAARIRLRYRADFRDGIPDPPTPLRYRVINDENLLHYWFGGLQTFGEFYEAIRRRRDPATVGRLLDWGCGCGRVTSFFLKYLPAADLHACDIDPEAIAWCRENLSSGRFSVIDSLPPTPYPDSHFEVVISYSVLTHLTQEHQRRWLGEIERVLAPGGLFLATVHGDFAASFTPDSRIGQDLASRGISDGTLDPALDGIAPEAYYRSTYQSRSYTVSELFGTFEVLDYVPGGMTNFQDLIVARKPGGRE